MLEAAGFELLLANPAHLQRVPGRKTDVKDAEWLAGLCDAGLLRGSFVPPPQIRQLRDLTRYRTRLVQDRAREVNRVDKCLEDAGIKLSSVASDTLGVSGRLMCDALIAAETDPNRLAELAKGRLRAKRDQLRLAMAGRFGAHHRAILRVLLDHIDHLDAAICALDDQVDVFMAPFGLLACVRGWCRARVSSLVAGVSGERVGRVHAEPSGVRVAGHEPAVVVDLRVAAPAG